MVERPNARKFTELEKYCPLCDKWLNKKENFRACGRSKSRYQSYCIPCTRKYQRERKRASSELRDKAHGEYRNWAYGLSPEAYTVMYEKQGGKCAMPSCGNPIECVDHDHKTDSVRALLCRKCNTMLGMARDNPQLLREAASYIEQHEKERAGVST